MPSSSLPRRCGRISDAPISSGRSPTTAAASAATVRRLAHADSGSLVPRLLSAIVLAPLPIAAIWFGSPWLPLLVCAAAAVLAWEWARLCRGGEVGVSGSTLIVAVVVATVSAALWGLTVGLVATTAGAALVWGVALVSR